VNIISEQLEGNILNSVGGGKEKQLKVNMAEETPVCGSGMVVSCAVNC